MVITYLVSIYMGDFLSRYTVCLVGCLFVCLFVCLVACLFVGYCLFLFVCLLSCLFVSLFVIV